MPANVYPHPFIIRPPADLLTHFPHLRHRSHDLALRYVYGPLVTEDDLQMMGTALWHALDIADAFDAARAEANPAILPLIIESDAPDIQLLPWETLYHPEFGFLGKSPAFTLSRRTRTEKRPATPPEPGPLRVLLFTSLPNDVDPEKGRLNVEEEQAQVLEALAPWEGEGTVVLEMPNDGQFSTLQETLKTFKPHLVFLSGHGKFHHEAHQTEPPYGIFLFEDEAGDGDPVRDERLAQAFIGTGVQAVVLSACELGKAASTDLTHGLAAQLRGLGIPHVIGMRESVLDRAGILFARTLCDELAQQERVDVALQKARAAITRPLEGEFRETAKSSVVMDASQLGELSLGQWCLPALQTATPEHPLITWDFQPQPRQANLTHDHLNNISLPSRFIGRRFDLREAMRHLGQHHQLLITGPGGQGKTALAGKLAQDFQRRGYTTLAWTARTANTWEGFVLSLLEQLTNPRKERYDKALQDEQTETEKATLLLSLLLEQTGGKLILFFDNLESIQNPDTRTLTNETLTAWIHASQSFAEKGLSLLLTSRWLLPDWPERDHKTLARVNYGDFLVMARQVNLPRRFLSQRDRLRQVYNTLHGNGRGLNFFAAAMAEIESEEEIAFLEKLAQAEAETQTDMALEAIIARLTPDARALLARLPVYPVPIPVEGFVKIALDLPDAEGLLNHLLAMSLVERQYENDWQVFQYQLPALVGTWLAAYENVVVTEETAILAADYQMYLFQHERRTLGQANIVHDALRSARKTYQADRFALDRIVGRLNQAGLYRTLLELWLPAICESPDPATRAEALGQTGKQWQHLGFYDAALHYNEASLTIQQQIGDKAGQGKTLLNLSQIFQARGDYSTVFSYLQRAAAIFQEIGDKAGEAGTLNNYSQIFQIRGDYSTALAFLQQTLAICRENGDKRGEGVALNNLAAIFQMQGDNAMALAYLQQALGIQQEIGDKAGEGVALNNLSQIFQGQGNYTSALEYMLQALAIFREIEDKGGEGRSLNNLSQIFQARRDNVAALGYLQQAVMIFQEIGDKVGEGLVCNNLSQIFQARRDNVAALGYLQQALVIFQEIGDKVGEGRALNNLSLISQTQEDYDTALGYLQQALVIFQEIGYKAGEGTTLNNLGAIAYARKDYVAALDYWQQALVNIQGIGDRAQEGTTLNNIAQIYSVRRDDDMALSYLQKALSIQREIGDNVEVGTTLNNISRIYFMHRDHERALDYSQQALAIYREITDEIGLCLTYFNLGRIHSQNNDFQKAVETWINAYQISQKIDFADTLKELSKLSSEFGIPGGLQGWGNLPREALVEILETKAGYRKPSKFNCWMKTIFSRNR